ncbi:MAG: hypothetical protein M0Q53_00060 [Prolixibacteraceae bacterium]|jgi:hypothetical protein|nr:hypothetical protein [Prolixibacteraceae bacterium]
MKQNYLHGDKSPKINASLAASAWNFKKLMFLSRTIAFGNFYMPVCAGTQ